MCMRRRSLGRHQPRGQVIKLDDEMYDPGSLGEITDAQWTDWGVPGDGLSPSSFGNKQRQGSTQKATQYPA